jgi:hypothetical protein
VDTAAKKLTETVSRQNFTALETMHDNEYRIDTVTSEKHRKCVSRQETWRGQSSVCLFFFLFGCGVYYSHPPVFLNQSSLNRLGPAGAGGQTGSPLGRALLIASAHVRARPQSASGVRRAERGPSFFFCLGSIDPVAGRSCTRLRKRSIGTYSILFFFVIRD